MIAGVLLCVPAALGLWSVSLSRGSYIWILSRLPGGTDKQARANGTHLRITDDIEQLDDVGPAAQVAEHFQLALDFLLLDRFQDFDDDELVRVVDVDTFEDFGVLRTASRGAIRVRVVRRWHFRPRCLGQAFRLALSHIESQSWAGCQPTGSSSGGRERTLPLPSLRVISYCSCVPCINAVCSRSQFVHLLLVCASAQPCCSSC